MHYSFFFSFLFQLEASKEISMKEVEVAGDQGAAVVVTSVIVRVVLLVKEDTENAITTPIAALVKPVMLMVS